MGLGLLANGILSLIQILTLILLVSQRKKIFSPLKILALLEMQ